jgi:glycosyltransferase involved in cell wall biosynthesis
MIARDEERSIQQALLSARPFVQEIVVVDTGSSDKTIQLAKRSGANVISFEWCDDFAAARNAALQACTGDWVLSLDADEVLASHSGRLLPNLVSRPPATYIPLIDWKGKGLAYGYGRLFPRAGARWKFRICEEMEHSPPLQAVPVPEFRLLHNPHNELPGRAEAKRELYHRMAKLLAEENASDPYALFRAAQTIFSLDPADQDAPDMLQPVLHLIPSDARYGSDAFYIEVRSYRISRRISEGIAAYEAGAAAGWTRMAHAAEYAELLHMAGRDDEALAIMQKLESSPWDGYMDEGFYRSQLSELQTTLV